MTDEIEKIKVVIAEDSAITADILRDLFLLQWKTDPVIFHNGKEALDYLIQQKENPSGLPHLIVLDIALPGENGIEILKKIKADEILRQIHVIMNTGSDNFSHMLEIKKWPAVTYARKGMNHTAALQEVIAKLKLQGVFKKG
jgi:two-component system, response regulator